MDNTDIMRDADLYGAITEAFGIPEQDIMTYSPLALAFIGDCVYDMLIRSIEVAKGNTAPGRLHRRKADIVQASAQAKLIEELQGELTEEELSVYKRGRNAHTISKAKNASDSDYRKATGFEAMLGYLYMKHDTERILKLLKPYLERIYGKRDQ